MQRHESFAIAGIAGSPLDPELFALEIADGRITRTWSRSDWADASPGGRILDVGGATVLPGIDDSHLHGYEFGRSITAVDVGAQACPSLEDLQDAVRQADPESTGWVRGIGWDDTRLRGTGPSGQLCAADLDAARTDVPVLLSDVTGHQAVCNSLALRLAGLDSASVVDPIGGVIVRDPVGLPTGLLREAAVAKVNSVMPSVDLGEKRAAIRAAQDRLLAMGVTAFTDPGLGPGASTLMDGTGDLEAIEAYRQLADEGALHLRVDVMLLYGGLGGTTSAAVAAGLDVWGAPRRMAPHGHLGISQVKVFADGIPRSRTAWMHEPYDDCSHGHLTVAGSTDEERVAELEAIVREAASRGWQIGVHTIGDHAIDTVVGALVALDAEALSRRHYVIHGDFASDEALRSMSGSSLTLNANPSIRWSVGDGVNPIIGAERNASRQRLRTAWDLGVNVCASSDAPVAPPDWRVMVAAAVTRSISTDPLRTDSERLTMREALLTLTRNPAWQSHAEQWRGALTPGMAADLVVLERAVQWDEPWSLTEASVRATLTGGQLRYGSL